MSLPISIYEDEGAEGDRAFHGPNPADDPGDNHDTAVPSVLVPDDGREIGAENIPNASLPSQSQQTTKGAEDSSGRKKRKSLYGRTLKGRNQKKKECPVGRDALNAEVEHQRCLLARVHAARLAAEGKRAHHVFDVL